MTRSLGVMFAVAVFAYAATAQPPGGGFGQPAPTPGPLIISLLNYVGDETLTAELNLTPEQVKTLTEFRKTQWDEQYATPPAEYSKGFAGRQKAAEKLLLDTLSPEQAKRGKQLAAQLLLTSRGFEGPGAPPGSYATRLSGRVLAQYPELAEAVTLTDEQKKFLTPQPSAAGRPPTYQIVRFTPEQAAALKGFLGPVPTKPIAVQSDPRTNTFLSVPAELNLLLVKDVQSDLKLGDDAAKTLAGLSAKWSAITRFDDSRSPAERATQAVALKAETEKALADVLTPEQATRVKQITLQRAVQARPLEAVYSYPAVVEALDLTDLQQQALATIQIERASEVGDAFDAGNSFDETKKRLDAIKTEKDKKAAAVLTADQAAKYKALVGAPYTGAFTGRSGGPAGNNIPDFVLAPRRASFGKYTTELTQLARNADLQKELNLTPEQAKKVEAAAADYATTFAGTGGPPPRTDDEAEKYYSERSVFIVKALGDILTDGQAKRFREVMLQFRDVAAPPKGIAAVVRAPAAYPGVAEAIKLSPEQKKRLVENEDAAAVLTDDQKATVKTMMGEPYKGSRAAFGVAPPSLISTSRLNLLGPGGRSTESLKLSPEQQAKVQAAYQEYLNARSAGPGAGIAGTDFAERAKLIAAAAETFDKTVAGILSPEQMMRLDQLAVQSDAAANLATTLMTADVTKKLGLTPEQGQKISTLYVDADRVAGLLPSQGITVNEQSEIGMKLREKLDMRILAVLTDPQKATWNGMTGESAGMTKTPLGTRFGGRFGGP